MRTRDSILTLRARRPLLAWLLGLATVLQVPGAAMQAATGAPVGADAGPAVSPLDTVLATGPRLTAVSASQGADSTTLVIEASGPVAYVMSQPDPFTVVVDLRNVRATGADNNVAGRIGAVAGVSIEQSMMADGVPSTRVRVRLNDASAFNVRSARNLILVEVQDPAVARFADLGGTQELAVEPDQALRLLQTAASARPDAEARLAAPMPVVGADAGPTGALAVAPGRSPVAALMASPAGTTPAGGVMPPVGQVAQAPVSGVPQATAVAAQSASPRSGADAAAQSGGTRQAGLVGEQPAYTGHAVSLDFQGADLRAVLRTFTEISGLNMVIDPSVQGSVDVSLTEVPWDQALDVILRANKLGYHIDGTIVRIAPLAVLAEEEAQRRRLAEEQALAGELKVFTRSLSYAKADDLAPLLTRTALTERGQIQVDTRTNTVIITDLPEALQTVSELITTLDRPQPQVEIEARIVQTTREFARAIGVQWGGTARMTQDLANTTGIGFPNQGSLSGRTGSVQGPFTGDQTRNVGTAVDMAVEGATTAAGLALGSINGAVNLDLALSALEREGNGRLLSTPRVSTQNNVEAEITQGVQIPYQTVANNTVTVAFKDAALTLKVTPQITEANTVIMRIQVENAAPDFSRSIKDIPPIDTQRAITQVLVSDGQTTVIGGIYVSREQASEDKTPGLSRIPLIGWLFKRQSVRDESRELLIFITPRIVRV